MKTLAIILGIKLILVTSIYGQCTANYSYIANGETLSFTNLSSFSNAHFYWNFGDGSGSNDHSPIHVFRRR
ncbi:MAG: PKD domain-containing protein [Bacteroidetes bacterium]|nr:PKD domain-containing protein [Bacteroidota bacterium]